MALAAIPTDPAQALQAAVLDGGDTPLMGKQPKPKPERGGDPLIARLDAFANSLLDTVQAPVKEGEQPVEFRDRLDVLKELIRWVSVKKGIPDDDKGEHLNEFKRRLRQDDGTSDSGKIDPGRYPRTITRLPSKSTARGGSALDAIKARIPSTNAGDDAGGGNGAVGPRVGAFVGSGSLHSGGDGDE
jgi:hypothetical protein